MSFNVAIYSYDERKQLLLHTRSTPNEGQLERFIHGAGEQQLH